MERKQPAKTRAEAEQLDLTFSRYSDWRRLGYLVDGYALCNEIGVDAHHWRHTQWAHYEETNTWDQPTVELVMLLFFEARRERFVWGIQPFDKVDSLLHEIAKRTGQNYQTDLELRKQVLTDMRNFPRIYNKDGNQIFPPKAHE